MSGVKRVTVDFSGARGQALRQDPPIELGHGRSEAIRRFADIDSGFSVVRIVGEANMEGSNGRLISYEQVEKVRRKDPPLGHPKDNCSGRREHPMVTDHCGAASQKSSQPTYHGHHVRQWK